MLHLDLDAFYAAVEQRDKPSLRGRPVVVGGLGPRGVVSTASYEARRYGVRSAMSMAEARRRCPHAAFLAGRFGAYHRTSEIVMAALRDLSPLVEPLSLDEAFVDLVAGPPRDLSSAGVRAIADGLRRDIVELTRLTASVGAATSKLLAKIASEQAKPDGLVIVEPGTELDILRPLPVRALWGVGPATASRLTRLGVRTVGDLDRITQSELVDLLGEAHGLSLYRLARAVTPVRFPPNASPSPSAWRTPSTAILPIRPCSRSSKIVHQGRSRLGRAGLSGRTITVKIRLYDFTTLSRSVTLPAPTDDATVVERIATRLLREVDTTGGIRLLGVGVSGLADWVQRDLFADPDPVPPREQPDAAEQVALPRQWVAGMDVVHRQHGPGWVGAVDAGASRSASKQLTPVPARFGPSPKTTPT